MDDSTPRRTRFLGKAAESTQRLIQELIDENKKLWTLASAAERENGILQQQLNLMGMELERQRTEQQSLRAHMREVESASDRFSREFAEVEQRNSDLANLYVSSYQLHGTLERGAVLMNIREIVINLIGCEQLAVFEKSEDGSTFDLVTAFGIDERRWRSIEIDHPLARVALSGEMYVEGHSRPPAADPGVLVCVPLKIDGEVTGLIALFSFLSHKPGLQDLDFELFDLLATHAATALYCSGLRQRLAKGAVA